MPVSFKFDMHSVHASIFLSLKDRGIIILVAIIILLNFSFTGHGLVVSQLRENDQCGLLEELQPIDENRQYDFNFQQFSILPREVKVLPVS